MSAETSERNNDGQDPLDLLVVELRMRRDPSPMIGGAVANVRKLLADSGSSAEDASGLARNYAASIDLPSIQAEHLGVEDALPYQ